MWDIAPSDRWPAQDVIGIGMDLEPETILGAYRVGLFPMPFSGDDIGWWSPLDRGVLRPADVRVSRSLRRSMRDLQIRVDTAFDEVIEACADPSRPGGWISDDILTAYQRLHRLGWAHSVEAWAGDRLVGGLYGLSLGGLFAGESMFHRVTDASKAALVGLTDLMSATEGPSLIDVQWSTDHLASLGVVEIPREEYLAMLPTLTDAPPPAAFSVG